MHCVIESQEKIISSLFDHMVLTSPDLIFRGKRRYYLSKEGKRRVFFLTEGDYLLKLRDENKIITIISAPSVIGLAPSLEPPALYLEKVDYGKIYDIDYDTFWRLVYEKGLISDSMALLAEHYTELMNYIAISKSNSRDQVLSLIKRWEKLPPHLKKRFSVLYLLENSSYLSKSSISRVLKELKDKGKITLDRGRFRCDDETFMEK